MSRKLILKTTYVLAVCLLLGGLAFSSSSVNVDEEYYEGLFSYISTMHAMDPDVEELKGAALNGAMEGMSEYSCFTLGENPTNRNARGIGAALEKTRDGFAVVSVSPASPAYEAGLKAGDIITTVDKKNASTMGIDEFSSYILTNGTALLEVHDAEFGYTKTARVETSPGYDRDADFALLGKAGFIRIYRFTDETPSIVQRYIEATEKAGRVNLIVDLRDLVSMDMENGCEVALMLSKGGMVARTGWKTYSSSEPGTGLTVTAIINENTKGAGEVIAKAPGVKTYGEASGGYAAYVAHYPVFTVNGYDRYTEETGKDDLSSALNYIKFMKPEIPAEYVSGYIAIVESGVYGADGKLISKQNPAFPDVFVENTDIGYMDYKPEEGMIDISRDYSQGSVNYDIFMAKTILSYLGFYNGTMDVVFGEEMTVAVNRYKSEYGKTPDGILDKDTQAMLNTYSLKAELEKDGCIGAVLEDLHF